MSVLDRARYAHQPAQPAPRVSLARHLSSPEALPGILTARPHTPVTTPGGVPIGFGLTHEHEIYRMRTRPELYDERDLEAAFDLRDLQVPDDMWDWDCARCRMAVITEPGAPCPMCKC